MAEAYIIDTVRTPRGIGKVGKGALADMHPQHLGAAVGQRRRWHQPLHHDGVAHQTVAHQTVAHQTVAHQTVANQTVANQHGVVHLIGRDHPLRGSTGIRRHQAVDECRAGTERRTAARLVGHAGRKPSRGVGAACFTIT